MILDAETGSNVVDTGTWTVPPVYSIGDDWTVFEDFGHGFDDFTVASYPFTAPPPPVTLSGRCNCARPHSWETAVASLARC